MKMLSSLLRVASAAIFFVSSSAFAQTGGILQPGQVLGNFGASPAPAKPSSEIALFGTPFSINGNSSWVTSYMPGQTPSVIPMFVVAPLGNNAAIFSATRGSDNPSPTITNIISNTALVVNDNSTVAHNYWAGYDQCNITPSALTALMFCAEMSIQNSGAATTRLNPFNVTDTVSTSNQVAVLKLDNGAGLSSAAIGAALIIGNNGGPFMSGVICGADAVDVSSGFGPCFQMAIDQGLEWVHSATGTAGWRMFSNSDTGNGQIILGDVGTSGSGQFDLFLGSAASDHPLSIGGGKIALGDTVTAPSLALGGATIGTNALAVTGSSALGATTITGSFTATGLVTNADLTHSTISGVSLGSNLFALSFGTHLTGSSYNGSAAVSIGTDATNANTVSTIVSRDGSGNFAAGTITASVTGHASLDLPLTGGTVTGALTVNYSSPVLQVIDTQASGSEQLRLTDASSLFFSVGRSPGTGQFVFNMAQSNGYAFDISNGTQVASLTGSGLNLSTSEAFSVGASTGVTKTCGGTIVATGGIITSC